MALCGCSANKQEEEEENEDDCQIGMFDEDEENEIIEVPEELASEAETDSDSSDSTDSLEDSYSTDDTDESGMYDVSPIVEAYRSGNLSELTDTQFEIYEKAANVLDEIIKDGMDDYEKELAVHDWIIYNCTYDEGSLSAIPRPSENCDNPYGVLINGEAICRGYTTTFRMFMGMLGIPCGTVHAEDIEGDEHAWNTVKLDGSWYYVDCTWDDPVPDFDGRPVRHTYFNVSREEIAVEHILPDGAPDTESLDNSFYSRSAVEISDIDEIYPAVRSAIENNQDSVVLIFDSSTGIELEKADDFGEEYCPEDENLEKALDGIWEKLVSDGETVGNSGYVFARRVNTSSGIGLLVEVGQYQNDD
jgi:hypothetical protein